MNCLLLTWATIHVILVVASMVTTATFFISFNFGVSGQKVPPPPPAAIENLGQDVGQDIGKDASCCCSNWSRCLS